MSSRRFVDDGSGLVFSESSTPASTAKHRTWQYACKGSIRHLKPRSSNESSPETGAPSLLGTSIRFLARNTTSLTPEHFAHIAWPVAKRVWEFLESSELVSVYVWKTFALAYPGERAVRDHWANASAFVRAGSLEMTWGPAVSESPFAWITALELANVRISRLDLLALPEVVNLGVLMVGPRVHVLSGDDSTSEGIDNGIMSSWASSATERGLLSCLRALCVCQEWYLPASSLTMAARMPSLGRFTIDQRLLENKSQRASWVEAAALAGWEREPRRSGGGEGPPRNKGYQLYNTQFALRRHRDAFAANSILHAQRAGEREAQRLSTGPMLYLSLSRERSTFDIPQMFSHVMNFYRHQNITTAGEDPRDLVPFPGNPKKRPRQETDTDSSTRQVRLGNIQDSGDSLAQFGL